MDESLALKQLLQRSIPRRVSLSQGQDVCGKAKTQVLKYDCQSNPAQKPRPFNHGEGKDKGWKDCSSSHLKRGHHFYKKTWRENKTKGFLFCNQGELVCFYVL